MHETHLPAPDVPAASPSFADLLPFPLQLPGPEQIAAWAPIAAVWMVLGVAALGTLWLALTLILRVLVWRPRSAGRFTFTQAQELASQTLLGLAAVAILASSYVLPSEYLTGVIPLSIFVGFCTAVPGEKGCYTWGRLFREWHDDLHWYRGPSHNRIADRFLPEAAAMQPVGTDPQVLRLREKLEKIEAQVNHISTHPHQREVARRARARLIKKMTALEDKARE